jgi:hypothetical protein
VKKVCPTALRVDAENGNTLWWDAIVLEMSNVRVAFEEYDGELTQDGKPKNYKFVSTHMVFDVNLGENYRRKARLVADGHKTDAPTSTITYSSAMIVVRALFGLKSAGASFRAFLGEHLYDMGFLMKYGTN